MYRRVFIKDFSELGRRLVDFLPLMEAEIENPFFTSYMQRARIKDIVDLYLNQDALEKWLLPYSSEIEERKLSSGIVMAGNIPLVGIHDLLCVLACGYIAVLKPSSKDSVLLHYILKILFDINSYWRQRIFMSDLLPDKVDFIIATGNSRTASFFDSLYSDKSRVIRGARASVAILSGNESDGQMEMCVDDLFLYFGLGCRSVSTLFVPEGYDLRTMADFTAKYSEILNIASFRDNYRYNKAIFEMRGVSYYDGGFFVMRDFGSVMYAGDLDLIQPPLAVVNVFRYSDHNSLKLYLDKNRGRLQVVVGNINSLCTVSFGDGQRPSLTDYADGVNILEKLIDYLYLRIEK